MTFNFGEPLVAQQQKLSSDIFSRWNLALKSSSSCFQAATTCHKNIRATTKPWNEAKPGRQSEIVEAAGRDLILRLFREMTHPLPRRTLHWQNPNVSELRGSGKCALRGLGATGSLGCDDRSALQFSNGPEKESFRGGLGFRWGAQLETLIKFAIVN